MNSPKSRCSPGKARPRQAKKSFNLARFLSFLLLLLVLTFSLCAVGYVIFFRTVVAGELPPASHDAVVFEEPDPPLATTNGVAAPHPAEGVLSKGQRLPRVAIVIDDLGYDQMVGEKFIAFPCQLTYAFLPFAPHTGKLENIASNSGKTIFLHLPLEPISQIWDPGPGALLVEDSPEMQEKKFFDALAAVPHAVGMNNHMGSLYTADRTRMRQLLRLLANRNLMFLDSLTAADSLGRQVAREEGVRNARRNIFLDNILDEQEICLQLEKLIKVAELHGEGIGIAHPHIQTFNALNECTSQYKDRIEYVSMDELLKE